MMNDYAAVQPQTVYQADPGYVQTLKALKQKAHETAQQYIRRTVRIHTLDGRVLEGQIVSVDDGYLYLLISPVPGDARAFYNPYYSNVILPLVLYELLVISLLY